MRNFNNIRFGFMAFGAMLVMILDTKTAFLSAQTGLQLCLKTAIPSLFPFFVLSGILNSNLFGRNLSILRPICKVCKIPKGGESLLLLGFLGGYPVGAQLIAQVYTNESISKKTAQRMLGFCNNAGPAFLFGMTASLFTRSVIPWILWGIHITSALITGCILPADEDSSCKISPKPPITLPNALQNAIKNMASVCGWVILFRILIGFCEKWFLWLFPEEIRLLLSGILELTNGIAALNQLPNEGLRFIFCSGMLAFGGLCVFMQTISVTESLGAGFYFPGKLLQCVLSILFSIILQPILFQTNIDVPVLILILGLLMGLCGIIIHLQRKKVVAFA